MSSRAFKYTVFGAIVAALFLILCVSCSQPAYQQQPVYAQPQVLGQAQVGQAPVVIQQAPQHDGFFTGMLMGHLMSGGYGSYGSHTTTIIHAAPAVPAYRAPAPAYRPAPINTTPRPSFTTNSRGVSTSISRSGSISVRSSRGRR